MPDNEPKINIVNERVNSLEGIILRNVEASEAVAKSVNELLLKFKERDVRHEFERKESAELAKKMAELTVVTHKYIEDNAPVLTRAKKVQDRWDGFYNGMSTTSGKLIIGLLILGIAVMLGLDPRTLLKP